MLEVFGWFAAVTSGMRAAPQIIRLRRSEHHSSVSAASMAFTGMNGAAWVVWSASTSNLPVLVSSAMTALGFFEIARRTRRAFSAREVGALTAALTAYIAVFLAFGAEGLGVLGSAGSTIQFLPQARRALRAVDRSAIAPGTYLLAAVNELSWLIYATLTREALIAVPYLLRLPTSILILTLALKGTGEIRGRMAKEPGGAEGSST